MNLDKIIKDKSQTEIGQKLVKMLTNVWDDKEFILGCLVDVSTDEKKQKLIDAIENDFADFEFEDDITETSDKVLILATEIDEGNV